MTIDLKWGLPFAMPFAVIAMIKAIFWFAGAPTDPGALAFAGVLFGSVAGFAASIILAEIGEIWPVNIGKARHND